MNLKDSKEPKVSGKSESRQSTKLIMFTSPKGNHFLDTYGYTCRHKPFTLINEWNYIDEKVIKEILNNRK